MSKANTTKNKKNSMEALYDRIPNAKEVCTVDGCNEPQMDNPPSCETCEIVSELYGMAQYRIIEHFQKSGHSKQQIREFCNESLEYLLKQV